MLYRTLKDDVMKYFNRRTKYAFAVLILLFLIMFGRLIYLQVFRYDYFMRLSENNRIRTMRVRPDRGFIKDRNGAILVRNAPAYEMEVIKEDVKELNKALDNISETILINKSRVMKKIKQSYLYESVRVARGLSFEQFSYFNEHSDDYQGFQFVIAPVRSYTDSRNFAHVLGYLGEVNEWEVNDNSTYFAGDIVGRTGIEKQYDLKLRGLEGSKRVEVDSYGRIVETLSEEPSVPGKNLLLTVDYKLQEFIATLLAGRRASVVVLDNADNSVLALYSAPTYDLNMFSPFITEENWGKLLNDENLPLLNRTIEGAYPPGSVYKILMATAGLMEKTIDNRTTFRCDGAFKTSPRAKIVHNCWKKTGHGDVNLHESLKVSCDVYYYNLGVLLGIDKMSEYSKKLSLGKLTGINLPNEKSGIYPSKEWKVLTQPRSNQMWLPGDTVNASIGQGYVTTTPLQVAVMVASIFNGGTVYVPRVVESVEDPITGEKVREPVMISAQIEIPQHIRDDIMRGLVSAVNERGGTSTRGRIRGLAYGGKTGTAQVVAMKVIEGMDEDKIPEPWRDHSWYAGVYPAKNPKYTIVVMIENGGSGGKSSAPVAAEIIKKMLELGYVAGD